jgi:phosphate ABC transporter, permease protein PstC
LSRLGKRLLTEQLSSYWLTAAGYLAIALFAAITLLLFYRSLPILSEYSLAAMLTSANWDPARNSFGFLPAIVGTIYVTLLSMVMGIPIAIGAAVYIAEYAEGRIKTILASFIDVLAAIPSVIFGLVALIVVVPFIGTYVAPLFGAGTAGVGIFTVSLVMAIVVTPFMISLSVESLESLPDELRETSLGVGATKFETIRSVLLRAAGPGIFSAILLGFGRVFGATIVPALLIGGQTQLPDSLFSTGQTLPTLIVNDFGELMSLPLTQSALIFVGLMLVVVVWLFNFGAMLFQRRLQRRWQYS